MLLPISRKCARAASPSPRGRPCHSRRLAPRAHARARIPSSLPFVRCSIVSSHLVVAVPRPSAPTWLAAKVRLTPSTGAIASAISMCFRGKRAASRARQSPDRSTTAGPHFCHCAECACSCGIGSSGSRDAQDIVPLELDGRSTTRHHIDERGTDVYSDDGYSCKEMVTAVTIQILQEKGEIESCQAHARRNIMRTLLLSTLLASASAFSGTAPSSSPPSPPPCVPLPDSDLQLAHEKCWADFESGRDACKLMPTKKERKKCMKENFDTFEIMTTR